MFNQCTSYCFFSYDITMKLCTSQDESYRYIVKSHFYLAFSKDFNIEA